MELLLSTPLTVKQILGGQWLALRRLFLSPVLAVIGLQLLLLLLKFSGNGAGGVFGSGVVGTVQSWVSFLSGTPSISFVPDLFAAAWIGMLVGLTARRTARAPVLTLFYAIMLPGLLFCVPNLFIDIPLIFWARDKLYRELRDLGSARYVPTVAMPPPPSANPVLNHRP